MQNHKVWTYWETPIGKEVPPYISACLESIKRYCPELTILTPSNVEEYILGLHSNWKQLSKIAHKADAIRVAVIAEHGGIWVDADTFFIDNISIFQNRFDNSKDFYFCRWDDGRILNGYFYGKEHSPIMREWLKQINAKLSNGNNFAWTSLGEAIISPLAFGKYKEDCQEVSRNFFLPINIDKIPFIFMEQVSYKAFVKSSTVAIGLNHSWLCDNFPEIANATIEELTNGKYTLFNSIFKE